MLFSYSAYGNNHNISGLFRSGFKIQYFTLCQCRLVSGYKKLLLISTIHQSQMKVCNPTTHH